MEVEDEGALPSTDEEWSVATLTSDYVKGFGSEFLSEKEPPIKGK